MPRPSRGSKPRKPTSASSTRARARTAAKRRRAASPRRAAGKPVKLKVALPRPRVGRKLSPGIVRLDYDRARGYIVRLSYRLTRTGWRPRFNRYFSDVKYGGKKQALAAAEAWLKIVTRTGRAPAQA